MKVIKADAGEESHTHLHDGGTKGNHVEQPFGVVIKVVQCTLFREVMYSSTACSDGRQCAEENCLSIR